MASNPIGSIARIDKALDENGDRVSLDDAQVLGRGGGNGGGMHHTQNAWDSNGIN